MNLNKNTVFQSYPQIDGGTVDLALAKEIAKNPRKIIVLDDDPTGTQTVHDVSVYTDWSRSSLRAGFLEENKLFYIFFKHKPFSTYIMCFQYSIMNKFHNFSSSTSKYLHHFFYGHYIRCILYHTYFLLPSLMKCSNKT